MGTVGIVQAALGNQQIVEDLPSQDGLGDDSRDVVDRDLAIPDPLRINHHGWTMFALVKAASVIGAGESTETRFLELGLESTPERLTTLGVAATPFMAGLANVSADENVMGKSRHV
jgi:hypothetical protein